MGNIGFNINQYYRVNIVSVTTKSVAMLPIYIRINIVSSTEITPGFSIVHSFIVLSFHVLSLIDLIILSTFCHARSPKYTLSGTRQESTHIREKKTIHIYALSLSTGNKHNIHKNISLNKYKNTCKKKNQWL